MTTIHEPILKPDASGALRVAVATALATGDTPLAVQGARDLLLAAPSTRSARCVRTSLDVHRARHPTLRPMRVALLSSFSIEFVHDHLIAWGLASGLAIDIYQPGFGTFRQEILDPESALYRHSPDVVVVAVEGEDWIPPAYREFFRSAMAPSDIVNGWREEVATLLGTLRKHSTAAALVHNFAPPPYAAMGAADATGANGQRALIQRLNDALTSVAGELAGVHIVDYAALVSRHGALNWYDARLRHYARAPIAGAMQPHLAAEYLRFLRALRGLAKKCLVVDLDNTLWGGIVGEDGPLGVALGATYPGSAFVEFQQHLLDLHARGVILAIASKNNAADVDEIFATNKAMVLAQSHFAAMEIHWRSKSESLQSIATRLNIGLEHVVFADDNPAECEDVRRNLPAVTVVSLPRQPERYADALRAEGLFDTLTLSDEDRRRGELYRQRSQAEGLRRGSGSVEDYYRDLQMELTLAPVDRNTLRRATQLTQKTNQFNVTTRRCNDAEILRRLADPVWLVTAVAMRDRFGDNGIVGLLMAEHKGDALEIETLLLSCRVIGRTVETAMLAHVCARARLAGAEFVAGVVIPTPKNEPVRDVFARHAFTKVAEGSDGATSWRLDLRQGDVVWPQWLRMAEVEQPVAPLDA